MKTYAKKRNFAFFSYFANVSAKSEKVAEFREEKFAKNVKFSRLPHFAGNVSENIKEKIYRNLKLYKCSP